MSRTLSLFTAVVLALSALSSAAPVDINSIAPIENTIAQPVITLEKRKKDKKSKKRSTTKKAASSSSSSSSTSGSFTGTGTWFLPATEGGPQGACGPSENENSPIVALNAPQYGSMSKKSSWCGKRLKITGPAGTAYATVNDACPECSHGDLDLTPVIFKKVVGNMNIGVGKITWSVA